MVLVAGFRMPQVERCKEWYAFCAFLLCLLIGTNDFFMVSSFVIAVCKEKAAELPFRSRWCLKPYPGTGVIASSSIPYDTIIRQERKAVIEPLV